MENSNISHTSKGNKIPKLIFRLVLPLLEGGVSGYLVRNQMNGEWFNTLVKPSFNPPSYLLDLFGQRCIFSWEFPCF